MNELSPGMDNLTRQVRELSVILGKRGPGKSTQELHTVLFLLFQGITTSAGSYKMTEVPLQSPHACIHIIVFLPK